MPTGTDTAHAPTFVELQRALPRYSPRAWRFDALAAASRAGALLSEGLRIGHRHGFDSGPFMAHVYDNAPRGRTSVGRAIDRRLLARRTCQAFREIRVLAREAIDDAIDEATADEATADEATATNHAARTDEATATNHAARTDDSHAPVIADLAAGPAPYLFDALAAHPDAAAIVGDIDAAALAQARAGAARLGVLDRTRFVQGSAFDHGTLARLADPPPTIVVELGLYGIYHDDTLIERHFRDLADTLAPRQIVFNVQTQNPEIEHIARVWRDHRGERCVWRLRPVELILEWAAAAGYKPASVAADSHRIYRVVRLTRRCTSGGHT